MSGICALASRPSCLHCVRVTLAMVHNPLKPGSLLLTNQRCPFLVPPIHLPFHDSFSDPSHTSMDCAWCCSKESEAAFASQAFGRGTPPLNVPALTRHRMMSLLLALRSFGNMCYFKRLLNPQSWVSPGTFFFRS